MEPETERGNLYKILLIGDSGVGKSNVLHRFLRASFNEQTKSTIGVDFAAFSSVVNGAKVRAHIWDTAGQECNRVFQPVFYQGAHAVLLVYDVSCRASFMHLRKWLKEARANAPGASILLVGNKKDLRHIQTVPFSEAQEFCRAHNLLGVVETSAKAGDNVEEAFNQVLEDVHDRFGRHAGVEDVYLSDTDSTVSEAPEVMSSLDIRSKDPGSAGGITTPGSSWYWCCQPTCGLVNMLWSQQQPQQNIAA